MMSGEVPTVISSLGPLRGRRYSPRMAERRRRDAALAVGLAACVLVPSLLFLGRYVVDGTGVAPAGSDTSQHVWRSEVVAETTVSRPFRRSRDDPTR